MKIRFIESRWLDGEDLTRKPLFREGSVHDLVESSAYRWVRRNFAVYVEDEPAPKPAPDKPAKARAGPVVAPPKGDAKTRKIKGAPLPVKGGGKHGGPGWNDG